MLNILAGFAQFEHRLITERTQSGLERKARGGGWPGGVPPFGYRIADAGKKGLSRLVIDENEAATLRRARELIVTDRLNFRQTAAVLNLEERFTRSGKPWSYQNLRARLLSDAVLKSAHVFRNADTTNGRGPKVRKDGTLWYGDSVVIGLPRIFEPDEVTDLRQAVGRTVAGRPKGKAAVYPLTGRVVGLCGKHYIGGKRHKNGVRHYRCSGKVEAYPGAPVCDDQQIPADELESAVWSEVVTFLSDPDQLEAMAREWVGVAETDQTSHDQRITDLDKQIKERQDALTRTVTDYARAGLPVVALEAATRALTDEVKQLQ